MPYFALSLLGGLALLQASLAPLVQIAGVRPDLVLAAVVCWGILRGPREALVWALAGGLAVDLLSPAPFGVYTLALLLVGILTGLGELAVFSAGLALPVLAVAVGTVLYHLAAYALLQAAGIPLPWGDSLRYLTLPAALVNALLAPLVFGGLAVASSRMPQKERQYA